MAGILDRRLTYGPIIFNEHLDAAGDYDRVTADAGSYLVEDLDLSGIQLRDQREGANLETGGIFGPATKVFRRTALSGSIRADSAERLEDMSAALVNAFDVERAQLDDPDTRGEDAFIFWSPTLAPPPPQVGTPIREIIFGRPGQMAALFERRSIGNTKRFTVELLGSDPRRYIADLETATFAPGSWVLPMPNWPVGMGVPTYPFVLIDLNGNGGAAFTITDGDTTFVMDLSSSGAVLIAVDMQAMSIWDTADDSDLSRYRTSDVDSWLAVPPGGSTWTLSDIGGIDQVVVTHRQARS